MKRLLCYAPLVVGLAVAVALSGCGGSGTATSRLTGKVIFKGTPLPGGNVILYASGSDSGAYPSPIQMDGTYLITNIPPGVYDVSVETETVNPDRGREGGKGKQKGEPGNAPKGAASKIDGEYAAAMAKMGAPSGAGGGGGGGGGEAGGFGAAPRDELLKRYVKIPEKYANKKTSNIRVEVDSGKNTKDITLD